MVRGVLEVDEATTVFPERGTDSLAEIVSIVRAVLVVGAETVDNEEDD